MHAGVIKVVVPRQSKLLHENQKDVSPPPILLNSESALWPECFVCSLIKLFEVPTTKALISINLKK